MSLRGWAILVGVGVVGLLLWYAALPMLAFQALARAGQEGDKAQLERLVDFPVLRANLKDELSARLEGAIAKDKGLSNSPFGALGALLAPSMVDQVVEAAVTPEGVQAMVRSGRAPLSDLTPGKTAPPPPDAAAPGPAAATLKPRPGIRFGYAGLDSFTATTQSADPGHAPLTWVMERRGLLGWKLTKIELPPVSS